MARIRTIKPEFPQSESIGRLSRDARLLYIMLFTIVDDAGRARASSRMLASLLYPYDDDAGGLMDRWMVELEQGSHVRRYEVDGSQYLEIVKWLEHQKIDKPSKSRLPAFVEGSRTVAKAREASATDLVSSTLDLVPHTAAGAEAPPDECDWFEEFWKEYPQRDGDNPKLPAKMKFDGLVKTGIDPKIMIAGAKAYATKAREKGTSGTQYIVHALKWLSEQRWADLAAVAYLASERVNPAAINWDASVKLWLRDESRWPRGAGNAPGSSTCRCPAETLIANGVDPESGRLISSLYPIHSGTEEMAALCAYRQGIKMRPPKVYEVETDGRVQTLCWAEKRWPPGFNDFGERFATERDEENAA